MTKDINTKVTINIEKSKSALEKHKGHLEKKHEDIELSKHYIS